MNRLEAALVRIQQELELLDVRWALIGGLAVSVRAEPRTTRDIDVAVVISDDEEAESIVRGLRTRGYREREAGMIEQTAAGRLATVRFVSPPRDDEGIVVDLMFASSGIEPEVVGAATPVELFPGIELPVASRGHLIALKVLAGRPQDEIDARALILDADDRDLEEARRAVDLIDRRGYSRHRDLLASLHGLMADVRGS